jgi:hypothetical protein
MIRPYRILSIAVIANGIMQVTCIFLIWVISRLQNNSSDIIAMALVYLIIGTIAVGFLLTFLLLTFPLVDKTTKGLPFYYLPIAITEIILPGAVFFYAMGGNIC